RNVACRPFHRGQNWEAQGAPAVLMVRERVDACCNVPSSNRSCGVHHLGNEKAFTRPLGVTCPTSVGLRSGLCQSVHWTRALHSLLLSVPPPTVMATTRR